VHAHPEPDLTRLAGAFRQQRERSGLTFDALAAASGLARQTLLTSARVASTETCGRGRSSLAPGVWRWTTSSRRSGTRLTPPT